ncbi:MAG TPA: outer membrane lipoprotein carrier protein LolA [Dissulfurispiraceae bacterium]|nr:outer membrane lipoprotein carrier protein LolA [Dissulfurispiraceae bacterium]
MIRDLIVIALCMSLLLLSAPSHSASAEETGGAAAEKVTAIQKAYEGIKDIKGSFVQKSTIKDLKKTETYKGQFFIKAKKMRWEYKGEKPQVVYITGKEIIIYQPNQQQAFKAPFSHATYGQAPIALLSGFGSIDKEFSVTMKDDRLHLLPKASMGNVEHVELVTNDEGFPIQALAVIDKIGNRVDITFSDVRTNTGIKSGIFTFKAPEGVAVLEQ